MKKVTNWSLDICESYVFPLIWILNSYEVAHIILNFRKILDEIKPSVLCISY